MTTGADSICGMLALDGKVAIVTGSSSGIGEAVARSLAAAGAAVVVNSANSEPEGEAVAASLPRAMYVRADVADDHACQALVADAVERFGRLDILVNNAGTTRVIPHPDLDAATDEVWRRLFEVNVLGAWHTTRAAVGPLRASGAGSVVNITSLAGQRPAGSSIPYAVSKAALNHLTLLLAAILGPEIRVNAVAPGLIDTPWTADWHDIRTTVRERAPLRRSGRPDDVAEAVLGLVQAGYVTGQVLTVDGGMSLR
jgi:ketoreductase RED2